MLFEMKADACIISMDQNNKQVFVTKDIKYNPMSNNSYKDEKHVPYLQIFFPQNNDQDLNKEFKLPNIMSSKKHVTFDTPNKINSF